MMIKDYKLLIKITTYPFGTNTFKVCESEVLSNYKWLTLRIMQMNKTGQNSKWPYIPDHPNKILIIGASESGKTNVLLNLINNQPTLI